MLDSDQKFKKREESLIMRRIDDELVIYDGKSHQGCCFNKAMTVIWENIDGRTTPARISNKLKQFGFDESAVLDACESLLACDLIETLIIPEQQPVKLDRRSVVKRAIGMGSIAVVPVITKLSIPSAYAQASCSPRFGPCTTNSDCCPGCFCTGVGFCSGPC